MTNNIILDYGGSNQITIHTTKVEELRSKILVDVKPGTNESTSKGSIIVDLGRVGTKFNIDGLIGYSDISKLRNIMSAVQGVFVMRYAELNWNVGIEKFGVTEIPTDSGAPETGNISTDAPGYPKQVTIKITVVVGKNFTSS